MKSIPRYEQLSLEELLRLKRGSETYAKDKGLNKEIQARIESGKPSNWIPKHNSIFSKRSYSAKSGEWSDRPGFSRHGASRPASKQVSKTFAGYKIYSDGDSWKTSLDPESDFDSEKDVKAFITAWNMQSRKRKYNPSLMDQLRMRFAKESTYNPGSTSILRAWGKVNDEDKIRKLYSEVYGYKVLKVVANKRDIESGVTNVRYLITVARDKKHNPEDIDALARGFHGREPKEEILLTEESKYSRDQVVIGLLEELEIADEDGLSVTPISFKHHDHRSSYAKQGKEKDTVYVTFPNQNQIEFIGGDQKLPMEEDKALVTVGPIYGITYWTDKHHLSDGKGFSSYHHHFGEESSKVKRILNNGEEKPTQQEMLARMPYLPILVYDTINQKCLLVGGVYSVKDEGITN